MSVIINDRAPPDRLSEIQASLDRISFQLLQTKFPEINLKPYFIAAESHIQRNLRYNRAYKLDVAQNGPIATIIGLSIDKIVSAYVLITGDANDKKVNNFIDEYLAMVQAYLETVGWLI